MSWWATECGFPAPWNRSRSLSRRLQAPVIPTWKALDLIPDDHPLYAGRAGSVGQRGANFTLQNSDFLLTLGARLDYGQIGFAHENFARGARKVVVDIDPAEIGKLNTRIDVPVAADAQAFLSEFLAQQGSIVPRDRSAWRSRVAGWKAKYPVVLPEYWKQEGSVNNYVFVQVLSEEMSGDDLLVPGSSGACSEITMQAFPVKAGMRDSQHGRPRTDGLWNRRRPGCLHRLREKAHRLY